LVEAISLSKGNIFPVVNEAGFLYGIVWLDGVKGVMFNHSLSGKVLISELVIVPQALINFSDTKTEVLEKFKKRCLEFYS
jgi:chloride channel protein, CIC family